MHIQGAVKISRSHSTAIYNILVLAKVYQIMKSPKDEDKRRRGKRKRRERSCNGDDSSSGSDSCDRWHRKRRTKHKKRRKHEYSSSDDDSRCPRKKKHRSKKSSKRKRQPRERFDQDQDSTPVESPKNKVQRSNELKSKPVTAPQRELPPQQQQAVSERAKSMVPMSREQYEAQKSIIREVYDEETGRTRLMRGTGEIIERIVSKSDHERINQQATRGDGSSYARHVFSATMRR